MTKLEEYEKQIKYHNQKILNHQKLLNRLFVLREIQRNKENGQLSIDDIKEY